MRIRAFRPDDAPALAELFHRAVHATPPRDYSPAQLAAWSPAPPDPARHLARAADGRLFLVAVNDADTPIAYADLEADGHLDHLYCRPDHAGRGVGAALCQALEREARARGIAALHAEASEAAKRLFERRGFTLGERRDFPVNGVMIHNYRMTKRLDPP